MAREIVAWCDLHLADSEGLERVKGHAITFSISGGTPIQLDLCPDHETILVKPLRDALHEHGIRADQVPDVPRRSRRDVTDVRPVICPRCGREMQRVSSLRSHAISVHGQTIAQLEGKSNYLCPAQRIGAEDEECGLGYQTPQGLNMHLSRTHGWDKAERDKAIGAMYSGTKKPAAKRASARAQKR